MTRLDSVSRIPYLLYMPKRKLKTKRDIQRREQVVLPENMTAETLLTRKEAAAFCRVDVRTVIRWIGSGKLPEIKQGQGQASRIKKGDLDRFLENGGKTLPTHLNVTFDAQRRLEKYLKSKLPKTGRFTLEESAKIAAARVEAIESPIHPDAISDASAT